MEKTKVCVWLDSDLHTYLNEARGEELTIPHPGIEYREFVLIPLFEITGYNYKVPKYGKISKLIKRL